MTFLWKMKSRVARISQRFVADLHSPSRNHDSLVVETGFPNSFVDLVAKNRNRLKKLSSRRNQDDDDDHDLEISNPVLTSPLPPHLVSAKACADLVEFVSRGSGHGSGEIELAEEVVRNGEAGQVVKTGDGEQDVSWEKVTLLNVLKVLALVLLGLITRKCTAVIAISAVLLLLFEFIRRWLIGSSVPCMDSQTHCLSITSKVPNFFGTECQFRNKTEERDTLDMTEAVSERDVGRDDRDLSDKIREINGTAFIDDKLIVAAYPSSVEYESRDGSYYSEINMRKAKSKRDEYFYGFPEQEDRRRDQDVKLKSKFMKMIASKKLKNPMTGRRNTLSSAAIFESEQPLKENLGKVEAAEVQIPPWKGRLTMER
ncbi:hypothetical protein MLD38_016660 [Melastoma candidum]|uniref:Uncharacterized protein n=1 Tax=Melastoma candidum TaxID=119954 RepID=A0ACB9QMI5_9MYRT|nr:hypothetical protein MLD38_016660 [Melastoma candidum]